MKSGENVLVFACRTLVLCILLAIWPMSNMAIAQDVSLLPKYGSLPKNEDLLNADKTFIAGIDKLYKGDRKKAAEEVSARGWKLLRQGNTQDALRRFNLAWLLDTTNGSAIWGMAAIQATAGKMDESLKLFAEAECILGSDIDFSADYAKALGTAGVQAGDDSLLRDAFIRFARLYKRAPQHTLNLQNWAITLFSVGSYTEAWKKIQLAEATPRHSELDQNFIADLKRKIHGIPSQDSDTSKIETCAGYARELVGKQKGQEWNAVAGKIKSTCPGTGFECTSYSDHPEKSKCEPFFYDGSDTFFKERRIGSQKSSQDRIQKDRFVVAGDEVYDRQTDRTWKRCNYGQTWDADNKWCAGITKFLPIGQVSLNFDSKDDGWRLPDKDELISFLEVACTFKDPKDHDIFPEVKTRDSYATSNQLGDAAVWAGDCFGIRGNVFGLRKQHPVIIRLVRQGQHTDAIINDQTTGPYPRGNSSSAIHKDRFSLSEGEVYDRQTDRIWKRCIYGQTWDSQMHQCKGVIKHVPIGQAVSETKGVGDGWRIPKQEELMSLMAEVCKYGSDEEKEIFGDIRMFDKYATSTQNGDSHLIAVDCFGKASNWAGVGYQFPVIIRLIREGK